MIDWKDILLTFTTLFVGGGWWVTWRAYKRKQNGEATQSEAEGWKKMQEVYQSTITDLNTYLEEIREDRNKIMEENLGLSKLNKEMRENYIKMEDEIISLKKTIARYGRKIDALTPFTCAVVTCTQRKKVEIQESEIKEND